MRFFDYEIEHRARYPWQFVQGKNCTLRLRCNEPVLKITVLHGDPFWFAEGGKKEPVLEETEVSSKQLLLDDTYYSVTIPVHTHKLRYHFVITLHDGTTLMLSELGVTDELSESQIRPFMVPYVFEREHYCAPDWAKNFVWYQIFPDRFAGEGDPVVFAPTRDNFFGGTLKGITGKIPYLKDLGVQGIYLNPIFQSPSNHRYDTVDYAKIDPLLGNEDDFRQLVGSLHEAGLRIMLDGVFNHCAWNHPFWQDVLHKGESSPYYEWFYIEDAHALEGSGKEKFSPEIIRREHPFACFAFAANMPKWNTENELVMDYLIGRAERWTRDFGIDAWRLDVPDEISMRFLREFKRRIRAVSDQIYIIGEIWQDAGLWLDNAVFDGAMDYPLYYAIRDFAMTGFNVPARIGSGREAAICMPGDIVYGCSGGVLFIPPTLAMEVVDGGRKTQVKDLFGFEMISQNKFTTAQIDKNTWTVRMLDLLLEFIRKDPRGEPYRDIDWSEEYRLAREGDPNDTQSAL